MRFTKLRLNGFKSFVDPTDLVIADGLTGVVGPNGCGKSNLLEALRWVMGENRPTAMRGGGMEDVIFAGASARPARNFAEVSLQIDNTERLAPASFNDTDNVEIIRRITRDAGSAYKANTRDVRARDVQMLFADASTGAQSPALVRQGQISELINAKPKNRRRILEEAAGISGLYQRRHEAELRLKATETNLSRVEDVLEQLAAQLAQLARQARQAARYREISAGLRQAEGVLLYRRWTEADAARLAATTLLTTRTKETSEAERAAQEAGKARQAAEDGLPPLREEEAIAAAVLQRVIVQRDGLTAEETQADEAIAGLTARIAQLDKDLAREAELNSDAESSIAKLSEEAEALTEEDAGHDAALAEAETQAREAASVMQECEAALSTRTEDAARLAARHQSGARLREEAEKALARNEADVAKARGAMSEAREKVSLSDREAEAAHGAEAEATAAAEAAEAALAAADEARAAAQSTEADARAAHSGAEGEASALRAEVAGLTKLVSRESGAGAQLLDQVTVAAGYEMALGAALADDLRAPVLDGVDGSGWAALPDYDSAQALPAGTTPLGDHVSAPAVFARRLAQIGLVAQAQGAVLQAALAPGQRLVSVEGDVWRWDGFRAAADDAPSAAALRLQQLNRLAELRQDLEEATQRAEGFGAAHRTLAAELAKRTEEDKAAREARRAADSAMAEASRRLSRAEAEKNLAEGRVETLNLAVTRHEEEASAARARLAEAEAALKELGDLDALRAEVEDIKTTVEGARISMMTRRSAFDELRRSGEARARRQETIAKDIASWRARLQNAETRTQELEDRKAASEAELKAAQALPETLKQRREALVLAMEKAEARRKEAADTLAAAETALRGAIQTERDAERHASEAREARARAEAQTEAADLAVTAAAERIGEVLETTPQALLSDLALDPDKMSTADAAEADVTRLKRQRDSLGAVNLRAEEDANAVQEEHDSLQAERNDLEEAIRALRSGIASLNREGRERMLTAFEEVNRNFRTLFTHLFGGGEANLVLVESDDPLEAGLEIMCQPPGKKLATLSLLSGGEQTLTALALIFAVFLANPAPICVLDEVDAPLDDANVTRFCDLLDEMCRRTETRFLIITHHAVTMGRMDRLFGVTMQEPGVSQLVSVDLKKAAAMVA